MPESLASCTHWSGSNFTGSNMRYRLSYTSTGTLPVVLSLGPLRSPPLDQPISVPTMLTGPQWINMPKRRSFQRSIAALGAPGSAAAASFCAASGSAAAKGREQKVRRFIGFTPNTLAPGRVLFNHIAMCHDVIFQEHIPRRVTKWRWIFGWACYCRWLRSEEPRVRNEC